MTDPIIEKVAQVLAGEHLLYGNEEAFWKSASKTDKARYRRQAARIVMLVRRSLEERKR